jgi:hypothetical protein
MRIGKVRQTVTEALAEAEEVEDAVEPVDWLAAYCCRALRNSDNSWALSVDAVDVLALLVSLALQVELVELVLDVELADAVASDGGGPPW